jgi:peroxiredoxin
MYVKNKRLTVKTNYITKFEPLKLFYKVMKKLLVIAIISSFCLSAFAGDDGYKIKIKLKGLKDTTCYLGNYFGNKQYYKDTARVDANGICVFQGKEPLPGGIYSVIFNNMMLFELVVNEPIIEIETDTLNYVKNMVIKKSEENKLFYKHLLFVGDKQKTMVDLQAKLSDEKTSETEKKEIQQNLEKINEEIKQLRLDIMNNNPKSFVTTIFKAMKEPEVPEFAEEKNDSTIRYKKYYYMKDHFWDDFDFKDDRLMRTPIYHNKLEKYFNKIVLQHPDSINAEADRIIAKTTFGSEIYKYTVHYITNNFEKSKYMGMDGVFVHMALKYYTHELAYWVDSAQVEKIQERAIVQEPLLLGKKAINLSLLDTGRTWVNMHKINADYTVLVFWDPECGHCKKELPKLAAYYETIRNKNIAVYAVSSNHDEAWKKFIVEHKLDFINVAVPQEVYKDQQKVNEYVLSGLTDVKSLNYSKTYDIFTTPQIYLLDKDKIIIGKKLDTELLQQVLEQRMNIKK